jgi:ubiquinone/menaquinone biosynthesis C-methylase UbiE
MRVLVPGAGRGDVAFLVAERVGSSGAVLGVDDDAAAVAEARRRARKQRFDQTTFTLQRVSDMQAELPLDAIVGRFFLMRERDPVDAIRAAARLVRPGGRIVFVEWHLESTLWDHTSGWPSSQRYRRFARGALSVLRRKGVHVDMGLRLVNAFVEAGLPLPAVRTDLRAVCADAGASAGPFADTLPELFDGERPRFGRRVLPAGGHMFLPLLVGAWTRKPGD